MVAHTTMGWVSPGKGGGMTKMRDWQPWPEAGRALGKHCPWWARVATPFFVILPFVATGPDRDRTRSWRTPVPSLRSYSARHSSRFTKLLTRNNIQPQSGPCHGPTGDWRLPTAMDKGSPAPPALSVWNWPWNKIFWFLNHWLVLLLCVVFWGKPPRPFPYCTYFFIIFNLYIFVCVHIYDWYIYIYTHTFLYTCMFSDPFRDLKHQVCLHSYFN